MKLELWFAVKPEYINQKFAENPLNPDGTSYYSRFKDARGNPLKGHMGIDFQASHGQPVHAPCSGKAWYVEDSHGGDGICIKTEPFDYQNRQANFRVILYHLCSKDDPKFHPLIPTDGSMVDVELGQLIGYADNSGAPYESSGDHLHFGLAPTNENGYYLEPENGYGGCIDPWPYFNGFYAEDKNKVIANLTEQVSLLTKVVSLLKKLLYGS